jgi:acetyl/propionyl-CoA carboxylase alpha subunit
MQIEFQRVAIVNRGEAAMRFIYAAREFNHEFGTSLRTIALFTEPDSRAMFVREADEAVLLGPAQLPDSCTGELKSSYVNYERLKQALQSARAEAVWAGWGFVAEHAEFADLCHEMGIVFIGPDAEAMRRLGDKISSKRLAEQAKVAVVPWSGGAVETLTEATHQAARLGYPLLIKATAGGGGHGIRRVNSPDQLPGAFAGARSDACKAFGNPTVFLEQVVHGGRHVEVQIIADHYGTTWAAGVRDCTIQRRHQKILEEAPSPVLSAGEDQQVREAAVRLSRAAGYHNAGTVEFLYQPEGTSFLFMEMNTRLQVEHPITEAITNVDIVQEQVRIAAGNRMKLKQSNIHFNGHAIEFRITAEDPYTDFRPQTGTVEAYLPPGGPGVRVDSHLFRGYAIPPHYDSLLAKLIVWGPNREAAIARGRRALDEFVIEGLTTTIPFHKRVLNNRQFLRGELTTTFLQDHVEQLLQVRV